MEENNVNQNDSSKVILLITMIVIVSILLIGFVFIAVLDFTHKEAQNHLKTTTRRTLSTTESITTEPVVDKEEETTSSTTTTTTIQVKPTTNTTKPQSTTKKVVMTEAPAVDDEDEIVIPANTYEIATSASTFPDAVDSWEREIVSLINAERRKNGLNELAVAKELRDIAEYGAYLYYENGDAAAKNYLINYSNYRMYSNLNISAKDLYTSTLNSAYAKQVITNQYLKYLGVGVIKKNTGLATYFYVLIYE